MKRVRIDEIKVGNRHRQDLGDLEDLKESIRRVDLLHPIVVTPDYKLIAGERRLEACRELGFEDVPVRVVKGLTSAVQQLIAERDENTCRIDMKPSEKVAIGRELEELERPAAEARSQEGRVRGGIHKHHGLVAGNVSASSESNRVRERVGEAVGMSGPTYQRAKAVVVAAEDNPKKFGDLRERMDETGKVTPIHNELQRRKRGEPEPRKKPMRTAKQSTASIKQAALNVDAAASGFDMDAYGDLSQLVQTPEAQEWIELLADASRRLSAHMRTVNRYRREAS